MYAIVEIQGQQFRAEAGKFLYVHYLGDERKEGETIEFDRVLLVDANGAVKVGAPTVEGAKIVCEVKVRRRTAVSRKANDSVLRFLAVNSPRQATLSNVSAAQCITPVSM